MIKKHFDFWSDFDNLCQSLTLADKKLIADSFKKAQFYATGMTDGWFDFRDAFEKAIKDNEDLLSIKEKNKADELLMMLNKSLSEK